MGNSDDTSITFTPAKLRTLKRAYAAAIAAHQEIFLFENREVLVAYAKYMIEYLEMQFGKDIRR